MAGSSLLSRSKAEVGFNMTPMIDCTFQLIIFFMLTTQMASQDYAKMELPKPVDTVSKELAGDRVVINIVPYPLDGGRGGHRSSNDGVAMEYRLRHERIDRGDGAKIVRLLSKARREMPAEERKKMAVEIRADKSLRYDQIVPVLEAVQQAEIVNMRLTALLGSGHRSE